MTRARLLVGLTVVALLVAACSSGSESKSAPPRSRATRATTTTSGEATPGTASADPCGAATPPPARYASVVVFSFENRSWDEVGPGFGAAMPYLHTLGARCSWFPDWTEADQHDKSLTQYVAQVTGVRQPGTPNDCTPSASCSTTADNLFRQLRTDGRQAVNYVEDATRPCSADGNAAKHIPALYLWGADDRAHCADEVRPLTDLDTDRLPAFAFVTPNLCNDGHDCGNDVVDTWARAHIQPVLDSAAYRAGKVAVFVWYDESAPVPNLWIAPTAAPGARRGVAGGTAGTLRAWQDMLGLPCLGVACSGPDLRTAAHA